MDVRIRVDGGGFNVNRLVEPDVAEAVVERLDELDDRPPGYPTSEVDLSDPIHKKPDS